MPLVEDMTWARSLPALASATSRSRYVKKSRRPLTSTGSAARAWATFCADGLLFGFLVAAADGIDFLLAMRTGLELERRFGPAQCPKAQSAQRESAGRTMPLIEALRPGYAAPITNTPVGRL